MSFLHTTWLGLKVFHFDSTALMNFQIENSSKKDNNCKIAGLILLKIQRAVSSIVRIDLRKMLKTQLDFESLITGLNASDEQ